MRLHLGGFFSFYVTDHPRWLEIELPVPRPLNDLLSELGIPLGDVNLVVINHELVDLADAVVKDEDEVRIYPPIGGG